MLGKISAQPCTTLCIQFLDRENNDKKQYIAIRKTYLFYNSMGLWEILPNVVLWQTKSFITGKFSIINWVDNVN